MQLIELAKVAKRHLELHLPIASALIHKLNHSLLLAAVSPFSRHVCHFVRTLNISRLWAMRQLADVVIATYNKKRRCACFRGHNKI